jgi:arylsulfatase A-like enzyme
MTKNVERLPNILLLVSEDCPPWNGAYGDRNAQTPHIDTLARQGVVYEQAFCSSPVCAPSRYSLITGMHAVSNAPAHQMSRRADLPVGVRTYPELLRAQGYYCTNNSKTHYNATVRAADIWDESSNSAHWRNRPARSPFLAVFNIDVTHESFQFSRGTPEVDPASIAVPPYLPDTEDIRADFAWYYTAIQEMDAQIGDLLSQLREDGLEESTVVIYTSDHGGVTPRSKRFCYDEGLHVPLIVSAPPRFAHLFAVPGTRVSGATSTVSLFATMLDLAGAPIPDSTQEPSLVGRIHQSGDAAFSARNRMDERTDIVRTIRTERYRYIRNFSPNRPWSQHSGFAWQAAGYREWERGWLRGDLDPVPAAFFGPKPPEELYDIVADPHQVDNLAGDPAHGAVRRQLDDRLQSRMRELWDNGLLPEGSSNEGFALSRVPGAYPLPRVLALAVSASERDPGNADCFLQALDDENGSIRYWAAQGLLMLSEVPDAARAAARFAMHRDAEIPQVRIVLAEMLAVMGDAEALTQLAALAGAPQQPAVIRLAALNALTAVPIELLRQHEEVTAAVARSADDDDEYLRGAARYLKMQLAGTYTPDAQVFLAELVDFADSST